MRLIKLWFRFKNDKNGFVLVFTALSLPLILLIGVLVLQSGQLFIRQAQLNFLTRQTAQSGALYLANTVRSQAEQNYSNQCSGLEPPEICSSNLWSDFIAVTEIETLSQSPQVLQALRENLTDFAIVSDPKQQITNPDFRYDLEMQASSENRLSLTLFLAESQSNWMGNVMRAEDYEIETQALAFLTF
jgi:hypothetical protein